MSSRFPRVLRWRRDCLRKVSRGRDFSAAVQAATLSAERSNLDTPSEASTLPATSNLYQKLQDRALLKFPDGKIRLYGLTQEELKTALTDEGIPKFKAQQIFHQLYRVANTDLVNCKILDKNLAQRLGKDFSLEKGQRTNVQTSTDGTKKFLQNFHDGTSVEVVFIPINKKNTVCISSQVGCTLTCSFCHTGAQPKNSMRNLTADEIVSQVISAHDLVGDWPRRRYRYGKGDNKRAKYNKRKRTEAGEDTPEDAMLQHFKDEEISNIVLMGQGEPLYNYKNVVRAVEVLRDKDAFNIGWKNITLSTSGVVPAIDKLAQEDVKVALAISLHAARDELRDELVPLNKQFNLECLMEAAKNYASTTKQYFITFEYCVLRGVNDTERDAHEIGRLLKDIPAHVNLIPFNPWPGSKYTSPSSIELERFVDQIQRHKKGDLEVSVRRPRGKDIMGACGQLNTLTNYNS